MEKKIAQQSQREQSVHRQTAGWCETETFTVMFHCVLWMFCFLKGASAPSQGPSHVRGISAIQAELMVPDREERA